MPTRPGEFVISIARVAEGRQAETGRGLPGDQGPGVGRGPADDEEVRRIRLAGQTPDRGLARRC